MTSRGWCWTINNPIREPNALLEDFKDGGCTYVVFQAESGDSGTKHYQGYCEFGSPVRQATLRRINARGHYEKRRGSPQQAREYCTKNGRLDGPWEYGELPVGRGKRTDLAAVKSAIDAGSSMVEIADNHFEAYCKYFRAFERYRTLKCSRDNRPRDVVVIYGPTGTGKTMWAHQYDDLYIKLDNCKWFDGYSTQKTILFDEFYGWIPYSMLLRITDRYVVQGETKGGSVPLVHDRIIFTTNQKPENWYPNMKFESFIRRVTKWIHMPVMGEVTEYDFYQEFLLNL